MESMGVEQERFVKASRNMNDYLLLAQFHEGCFCPAISIIVSGCLGLSAK